MMEDASGPELRLVCDRDVHDTPAPIVLFSRTNAGRWTYTMMRSPRGTGLPQKLYRPREHHAATGELARPWDVKTTLRCTECGDNLEVGQGKWGRLEAALDGLATVLAGQPVTLGLLRGAYQHAA